MTNKNEDSEKQILEVIVKMPKNEQKIAAKLHNIITSNGPELVPRLWYGMPAYSKDGKVLCFYRSAKKFGERYMTLGFNDIAKLDDGSMWPIYYAITELSKDDEQKVASLIKKAVS